jgi:hypothetical protein
VSNAASIALILMIFEALILSIVPLAILGGSIYGMRRLRQFIVRVLPQVHAVSDLVKAKTREYSDLAKEPMIRANMATHNARATAIAAQARALGLVYRLLRR